ncbi:peptidoglycan DD-metalloendopeptidase family protein [candidate division KSB1 bacterium]|nr:peptidoglycan DD-metalloendopeptidase family protein [candidate division KSB1 bacterium]
MNKRSKISILFLLALVVLIRANHAGEGVDPQSNYKSELQDIRSDIQKYEKAITQHKRDEASTLGLLARLDREIDVTTTYLRSLNHDMAQLERQIRARDLTIKQLEGERAKLIELIRKRLVSYYKYQRMQDINLLLSVDSWHKARVWIKYQKLIAENDQRNIGALLQRQQTLQRQQALLRQEKIEKENKLHERQREEKQLRESRAKRSTYLREIRKDQTLLQRRLVESKQSERTILELIARAEQARLTRSARKQGRDRAAQAGGSGRRFAVLKGRLQWPTSGTVVSHFGRQRHPVLNTITENLGIEIQAKRGTSVLTVEDGRVQTITWQRGSGNIIIISHDDGYYTVYAHLEEINVEENQLVKRGQTIGTVGESGSIHGPMLHFQIWKNTTNLDPEEWLS